MGNNIRVEDLHPTYQHIARIIGLENAVKLGRECGGENIYFPRLDSHLSSFIKMRDHRILDEYNSGDSVVDLGRRYKLTQRQIYVIIKRTKKRMTLENGFYKSVFYYPKGKVGSERLRTYR